MLAAGSENTPFFDIVFIDFSILAGYNNYDILVKLCVSMETDDHSAVYFASSVWLNDEKNANKKRRFGATFT